MLKSSSSLLHSLYDLLRNEILIKFKSPINSNLLLYLLLRIGFSVKLEKSLFSFLQSTLIFGKKGLLLEESSSKILKNMFKNNKL